MSNKGPVAQPYDRVFADVEQPLAELMGPEIQEGQIGQIAVGAITASPHQPRERFSEQALRELAASIKQQGLLQPLIVRPKPTDQIGPPDQYEIVAGERRWRAAKLAGLETVPCLVRELSDPQVRVIALIENLHREDLNPLERGRALRDLKETLQISWAHLAERIGLSKRSVLRLAGLVELPEPIQDMFASGTITEKHGRVLRKLKHQPERQWELAEVIKEHKLTGDETVSLTKRLEKHPRQEISEAVAEMREARHSGQEAGRIMKTTMRFLRALRETDPQAIEPATRTELAKALENIEDMVVSFRNRLRSR